MNTRAATFAPPRAPWRAVVVVGVATLLAACSSGGDSSTPQPPPVEVVPVDGPPWSGFAGQAQHTAIGAIASQPLEVLRWSTAVDLAPAYSGEALLAHYGSPAITRRNTVIVPVKIGAGSFRIDARVGATGDLIWSLPSDWRLPPHRWVPSFNATLVGDARVAMPASGGRVIVRDNADDAAGTTRTFVFYGDAAYAAQSAAFDASVFINTPITADAKGNVYFGFAVTGPPSSLALAAPRGGASAASERPGAADGSNPSNLVGGIARVAADGTAQWVSAAAASGDAALVKTATNSAPALSADEATLYVVVNQPPGAGTVSRGRLLALDAATLATRAQAPLIDPLAGTPAWVSDDATSSPMVGPDGDVYIGVLEAEAPSHSFRGWLLHFDATLAQTKLPGSFGWDNTPSVVTATMVPQYTGGSPYLLVMKSNSYAGVGIGDGLHRVAIVDPRRGETDRFSTVTVMQEVMSVLGPTPDDHVPGGVKEWCINTAAVDPATQSVLMNSEDGMLYRWHLPSNTLTERIALNSGYAQSYTPTAIGPDGRVYAVNNATLFSIGR